MSKAQHFADHDPRCGSPVSPRTAQEPWSPPSEPPTNAAAMPTHSAPPLALDLSLDLSLHSAATDRVYPIRSAVSVDPASTPMPTARFRGGDDYFPRVEIGEQSRGRRESTGSTASHSSQPSQGAPTPTAPAPGSAAAASRASVRPPRNDAARAPAQVFDDIASTDSRESGLEPGQTSTGQASSVRSVASTTSDDGGLVTHRFKHVVTQGGHAVITGRDGEVLQRCEDEPIHIPGAVQGFGLLIALREEANGSLVVRIVSENSKRVIGWSPRELFALESFTDILSEEQADNLLDHIDFIMDEDADVAADGPEVFTMSIKPAGARARKLWCAVHRSDANPGLIICEFELENDQVYPLVPPNDRSPDFPEDTLNNSPTEAEILESTENMSKPLRVLRSARKRKGEAAAMEIFNIMSQVQEQLASASTLQVFLKVLVGVVKELTGFHRVMIYQFDQSFNGRVVTELVDPRATKDLYQGLKFPASDIPKQAREMYKINKVRLLYDRDLETARLVCRAAEDLEVPLDLTHSHLRAMSPIHLKYLTNMAVRSSMSISINAFNELWGLVSCHAYGPRGIRVSFPIRKMCRLVGDAASHNIERLSYASRLQARKLINTAPTQTSPSGSIIASSDDLLQLFNADFGLLSIRDETKLLGNLKHSSQEALAMLEYLRMRRITSITTSQDVTQDFPDLCYSPGFQLIAGMLLVPLSQGGRDFIVFFRKCEMKEVKWAGNPYEKFVAEGTEGFLEPRKSFKIWRETVVGKSREWSEEEVETAAVLCLVYGKFIDVWRQKEAALQNSQLTRLLLANSAHEVRTPLNAIINYLEIALEGTLDQETRDNLTKSHSASKSLIYVINDLLDLTKTEEGAALIKGETFDLKATFKEATDMFTGDAKRKNLNYQVIEHPGLPQNCIGDQRRVRQAISNITANAIQHTSEGSVKVEMYLVSCPRRDHVEVEVCITDTGCGMNAQRLDQLFNELEQVQSGHTSMWEDAMAPYAHPLKPTGEKSAVGLGLAVVSRIIKNMNGQLRLKSEEGKGSRFVIQFPFDLPESEIKHLPINSSTDGSLTPQPDVPEGELVLVPLCSSRAGSISSNRLANRGSSDSLNDRTGGSLRSFESNSSHKSHVDRLIEAIREPHRLEDVDGSGSTKSMRPLRKRNSLDPGPSSPLARSRSLDGRSPPSVVPPHQRSLESGVPGERHLMFSATPLKPVKIPDNFDSSSRPQLQRLQSGVIGEVSDELDQILSSPESTSANEMRVTEPVSADQMRVLVAEDDPLNSRIIKKRLEKLGHSVFLTINGEECAGAFSDNPRDFDVILMDIQMPIVDGLISTKMIRSFEKTHVGELSPRAARCGRIPIIAVSASLLERSLHTYLDAGFDAWILKPISFDRLSDLMTAMVDNELREQCLYEPGGWEKGGWFHSERRSLKDVCTRPSGKAPQSIFVEASDPVTNPGTPDNGHGGEQVP